MTKNRGFQVITEYKDKNINLPKRATKASAGYDFEAAEDVTIPSIFKQFLKAQVWLTDGSDESLSKIQKITKPTLVSTGIKSYMNDDEYLELVNRSSNPLKNFLFLANGVGVIDSDYYNNEENEGHIKFQFVNFGIFDKHIKKGDKIGQGIFHKFLKADDDSAEGNRTGGFGSTTK